MPDTVQPCARASLVLSSRWLVMVLCSLLSWPAMIAAQDILPPRDIPPISAPRSHGLIVGIAPGSALFAPYQKAASDLADTATLAALQAGLADQAQVPLTGLTLGSGGEITTSIDIAALADQLTGDLAAKDGVLALSKVSPLKGGLYGAIVQLADQEALKLTAQMPVVITELPAGQFLVTLNVPEIERDVMARLGGLPGIRYVQKNFSIDPL